MIAILAVGAVTFGTLGLGTWGMRFARSTSDLLVASRAVTAWWNAAAISGEYLSAASFLGIAGLEMQIGASALWQSLGFTAGYLALLLFVAAPLRRFGSYTIPDFAEARLASPFLRLLAAAIVLVIGGFYLVPQLKGAGLALGVVTGAPYWTGVVVVGVIVAINVAIGGMRGITYVQAFQFWIKVFAISVPAIVLLLHFGGLPERAALFGDSWPRAGRDGLVVSIPSAERVEFPAAGVYRVSGAGAGAGSELHHVAAGTRISLPAHVTFRLPRGSVVPVDVTDTPLRGREWARPVRGGDGQGSPILVYSLLIATFLGTMGLPHILVRFYTNPDGHEARHTTVRVLGLLSLFYLFPAVYGALGRALAPQLYVTGATDDVVLRLPTIAWPGIGGQILTAITCAGAFAAFLSTSSGLLVSLAGTLSHDVWPRVVRSRVPAARRARFTGAAARRRAFRLGAVSAMVIPAVLALVARSVDISVLVGWAFAIAASTFCPLFLLGIWWTGLTARGAAVGMLIGLFVSTGAIIANIAAGSPDRGFAALLGEPALVSVPLAFATMVLVSWRDPRRVDASSAMLMLHAPEGLGLRLAEDEALV